MLSLDALARTSNTPLVHEATLAEDEELQVRIVAALQPSAPRRLPLPLSRLIAGKPDTPCTLGSVLVRMRHPAPAAAAALVHAATGRAVDLGPGGQLFVTRRLAIVAVVTEPALFTVTPAHLEFDALGGADDLGVDRPALESASSQLDLAALVGAAAPGGAAAASDQPHARSQAHSRTSDRSPGLLGPLGGGDDDAARPTGTVSAQSATDAPRRPLVKGASAAAMRSADDHTDPRPRGNGGSSANEMRGAVSDLRHHDFPALRGRDRSGSLDSLHKDDGPAARGGDDPVGADEPVGGRVASVSAHIRLPHAMAAALDSGIRFVQRHFSSDPLVAADAAALPPTAAASEDAGLGMSQLSPTMSPQYRASPLSPEAGVARPAATRQRGGAGGPGGGAGGPGGGEGPGSGSGSVSAGGSTTVTTAATTPNLNQLSDLYDRLQRLRHQRQTVTVRNLSSEVDLELEVSGAVSHLSTEGVGSRALMCREAHGSGAGCMAADMGFRSQSRPLPGSQSAGSSSPRRSQLGMRSGKDARVRGWGGR